MDKGMRKELETVVDSIINEDADKAQAAFHKYLRAKTQSILSEAEDKSEDEDDGDESEDKPVVGKKGVNPFAKKESKDSSKDDKSDESSDDYSEDK